MRPSLSSTGFARTLFFALLCLLLPSALASQPRLVIDSFTTFQETQTSASVSGPGILGGERDVALTTLNELEVIASQGRLRIVNPDAAFVRSGDLAVQWDGADGSPNLDPGGLGSVDLTNNGSQDALVFEVLKADLVQSQFAQITIEWSSSTTTFQRTLFLQRNQTGPLVLPLSSFITSPNETTTGALTFDFDGNLIAGGSFEIGPFTTTSVAKVSLTDTIVGDDGDGLADPSEVIEYTATITNSDDRLDFSSTGNIFSIEPDSNTDFTGFVDISQGTITEGGNPGDDELVVAVGDVADGETATVRFRVQVSDSIPPSVLELSVQGVLENSTIQALLSDDPNAPGQADPTVTPVDPAVDTADLRLTKQSPTTVDQDSSFDFTLTVNNLGPALAENLTLVDSLPSGLLFEQASGDGWSCQHDSGTVSCTRGSLASSASTSVEITVRGETPGSFTNVASVSAQTADPSTPNEAQATVVVASSDSADLTLDKIGPLTSVPLDSQFAYLLEVENLGPNTATGLVIQDVLPSQVTFVSAVGDGWSCEELLGTVDCQRTELEPNQSSTVTLTVRASEIGTFSNNASLTSSTSDPNLPNESTAVATIVETLVSADVELDKTDSVDPLPIGSDFTYSLFATNYGPDPTTGVVATDPLPEGLDFVSSSTGCTLLEDRIVRCELGELAVDQTKVARFDVSVVTGEPRVLRNVAQVVHDLPDGQPSNNQAVELTQYGVPPTVLDVTASADAASSAIDECANVDFAPVRFSVGFSEAMFDPPESSTDGDVTNPSSYQWVAAGPNGAIDTETCGSPMADDVMSSPVSVDYDSVENRATLETGVALEDGVYRLLVCGSRGLANLQGIELDGLGNGQSGTDLARFFRVEEGNRIVNGNFDCNTEGWDAPIAAVGWSSRDLFDLPPSGSADLFVFERGSGGLASAIEQCLPFYGGEVSLTSHLEVAGPIGSGPFDFSYQRTCTSYSADDCENEIFSDTHSDDIEDFDTRLRFDDGFELDPGTRSVRCRLELRDLGNSATTALIDGVSLRGSSPIFASGFESGDLTEWSDPEEL